MWRGNVGELRNTLERAILVGKGKDSLSPSQLPQTVRSAWMGKKLKTRISTKANNEKEGNGNLLKLAEETIIAMVLEEEKRNITKCARRLGIARSTLYQKIEASPLLSATVNMNNSKK